MRNKKKGKKKAQNKDWNIPNRKQTTVIKVASLISEINYNTNLYNSNK